MIHGGNPWHEQSIAYRVAASLLCCTLCHLHFNFKKSATKQNLIEMKNAFYRIIRGLNRAEKEIKEYEDMSV